MTLNRAEAPIYCTHILWPIKNCNEGNIWFQERESNRSLKKIALVQWEASKIVFFYRVMLG